MSTAVRTLQPISLWNHFADLNAVPRASKKEERVIQFIVDFAKAHQLSHTIDKVGNVIVTKAASPGMENRQTVVLQSHLDMVHQKNNDTNFDFDTEGIRMLVESDWVRADGTTLGADNGIGVATIMAVLSADDIEHPPVEALFTIDEETGMTGALGLEGGMLTGSILLNLDTEDDDELTIGCAGGVDITATGKYPHTIVPKTATLAKKLIVKGLSGGHSGMDIHKGLGNANKIMNRILLEISKDIEIFISGIDGGGLRNAIPRESVAYFTLDHKDEASLIATIDRVTEAVTTEHATTDSNIEIRMEEGKASEKCADTLFMRSLLQSIYTCPNGIYRMSPDIDGLVQTSNNVARVELNDGAYSVMCLTRSSVDSEKDDLVNAITSCFQLIGADVATSGAYPGWTPKPEAPIIKMMTKVYKDQFNEEPHVYACHAGLECGIIGTNYPKMDMISFGPNIRGAHSPDEKVQVSSVQKFWKYFLEVLKNVPAIES